jgi:hypothetical protein
MGDLMIQFKVYIKLKSANWGNFQGGFSLLCRSYKKSIHWRENKFFDR